MVASDDNENEQDRLKDIHHHLSLNKKFKSRNTSTWLPLESNPAVFTSYARSTSNLPQNWEFADVLGFGSDSKDGLLLLSPTGSDLSDTVAGAIFLFPTTDAIYAERAVQKAMLRKENQRHHDVLLHNIFHLEQVKGFGNACGTIAATHALLNLGQALPDIPDPFSGNTTGIISQLSAYKNACIDTRNTDIQDNISLRRHRGELLVQTEELHNISDNAAKNAESQTQCPESGDTYLGHHYCAFIPVKIDGRIHIIELDGTKIRAIDHGAIERDQNAFLPAVADIVKREWMSLEPLRIDFSMMALVKKA